ncbi:MAG: hypothetical protein AB7K24_16930 [Gemmataceae bacterium]
MFQLFHALAARLKALFVANVALDFESEFAARHADRKAELLRQAMDFEQENLPEVAVELRQRAADLDIQKPLASVLPSIEHWQTHPDAERPALAKHGNKGLLTHATKSKKRK